MELTIDKRKLDINSRNNFNLGYWDMVFWQNNPIQINNESETASRLGAYLEMELQNLYSYARPENFSINSENNPDIDRYFNSELQALRARGAGKQAQYLEQDSLNQKQYLAQTFGEKQYEEYKHLVDFFANSNYPASFQWLMLNETLTSSYRMDFSKGEPKLIVNARKPHQTILGMMNLPTQIIDYIYNNAPNYTSFKKLYTDAQVDFQKFVAKSSEVNFENVDTFGKGYWIKFNSQQHDPENFEQNVANLKALVADTPWCTSTLASTHLSQGDFYVFVDNNNKAHIAVKMNGNAIDEVRGIKNGNNQELEDDYRDVAVNFLQNNTEIQYGKEWLDKEEWNARLIQYRKDIENNTFNTEDVANLLNDLEKKDFRSHGKNSNLIELRNDLPIIKPQLAQYFNCNEEEICTNDYIPKEREKCPYKIILGNGIFTNCTDLGNLTTIGGNAVFTNSQVTNLGKLTKINGFADFSYSQVADFGNLQSIGGNAVFESSQVVDLGNLQYIGGSADFSDSEIKDLGALQSIGGNVDFSESQITDLGNLQSIGGYVNFENSQITDLGTLQTIGEYAYFWNSGITDLKNLRSVSKLYVDEGQIKKADFLENANTVLLSLSNISNERRSTLLLESMFNNFFNKKDNSFIELSLDEFKQEIAKNNENQNTTQMGE